MISARVYFHARHRADAKLFRLLKRSQYWDPERVRDFQYRKLKELIRHAYDNVPYYRKVFGELDATPDDIRSLADLKNLPVLTKELIRNHREELVAKNAKKSDLIPNATGGSTGEPLTYYQDRQYHRWANAARYRGWYDVADCPIGTTCAVLWGAMRDVRTDYNWRERFKSLLATGEIWLNAFNLSDERKETFRRWCIRLRPGLLRGYVTAIKEFARYIDESGLRFPRLRGIILCAETVDEETQSYIERVFQATSFNTYGGRETSLIAMECRAKNGLHEVSENNHIELEPIDLPGYQNAGNILVTNLNNFAMPFIRYRLGDIGIAGLGATCDCGRGLPLMTRVIGRTTDVFDFADGTKIAGEMFIHLMKDFPVSEYQFVQVSDRKVVLRMKDRDATDGALTGRIKNLYREYLPPEVELEIEPVERFERSPTGKFRFVFNGTRPPSPAGNRH